MSFHHSDVIPMSFCHSVIIPSFHNHSVHTHTPPMVIFYHPFVIWVVRLSFHHSWVILSFLSHSASFLLPSMALPKSLEIFCANKHSSQVIPEWLRNDGILSFEGHSKSEWPRMTEMRDEKWDLVRSSFLSKWPWNDCFLSFRPHPVIRDEGWTKRSRQSSN